MILIVLICLFRTVILYAKIDHLLCLRVNGFRLFLRGLIICTTGKHTGCQDQS